MKLPGRATVLAVILALGVAWLADRVGSAVIIGAFAAGLLLARTPQAHETEHGVTQLGYLFVPLFFVSAGAAVDVRVFNPLDPSNRSTLLVGGLLIHRTPEGLVAGYGWAGWVAVATTLLMLPLAGRVRMYRRPEVGHNEQ